MVVRTTQDIRHIVGGKTAAALRRSSSRGMHPKTKENLRVSSPLFQLNTNDNAFFCCTNNTPVPVDPRAVDCHLSFKLVNSPPLSSNNNMNKAVDNNNNNKLKVNDSTIYLHGKASAKLQQQQQQENNSCCGSKRPIIDDDLLFPDEFDFFPNSTNATTQQKTTLLRPNNKKQCTYQSRSLKRSPCHPSITNLLQATTTTAEIMPKNDDILSSNHRIRKSQRRTILSTHASWGQFVDFDTQSKR